MKWTVLSDNRSIERLRVPRGGEAARGRAPEATSGESPAGEGTSGISRLSTEHGLSILLQTERHSILLDTGASDVFMRNAELLGIDLSDVDYVFISHGHSDHAGGLRHLLERNQKAKVIVSPDALSGKFFSRRGNLHSITAAWPEMGDARLVSVEQTCDIGDGIHVIAHIPQVHPVPKGNQNLYVQDAHGDFILDDFRHELALYVDGFLFTGCAHSGLENILSACPWPVDTVVGGFHLLDGQETEEEIKALARKLKANYPDTHFFTSHCTGDTVFEVMKDVMGERLQSFRCGTDYRRIREPSSTEVNAGAIRNNKELNKRYNQMIDKIIDYNKTFVARKGYEKYLTDKYPDKKLAVLSCMDTRLTELLPAALGLKNGDAKIIKNAGGLVISAFDSAMRSLIVAIYELGVQEIMVVAHSHCGACHMSYDHFHHEMIARGVTDETLDTIRKCGIDLDQWLEGFKDTPTSVRKTVETIKTHPLVPKDIVVRGFIIDSETGALEEIQ